MCICAHGPHAMMKKTSNEVTEDTITLLIMIVDNRYNSKTTQFVVYNIVVGEKIFVHDYVTRVQWSVRDPVILVNNLVGARTSTDKHQNARGTL